jgi:DNA polymerase-4
MSTSPFLTKNKNLEQIPRKIIHIDMDCFYAAVEVKDNPSLKGKPVGVGGSPTGRGVLTTASYEARKFGVRSAMPAGRALKLCPDLILVRPNFSRYKEESRFIREIFREFTDIVQPLSLDEAYLDVTECSQFGGSATLIAQEIKRRIWTERQLIASAGVAPNKMLAKIASDWKKPDGLFVITPDQVSDFVKKLPVGKIFGVGKVTEKKLRSRGFDTCGDLQKLTATEMNKTFGKWGQQLYGYCRGVDNRGVSTSRERKSLSVENTFSRDIPDLRGCLEKLPRLYKEFLRRLDSAGVSDKISGYGVKVKFYDFEQTTAESSLKEIPREEDFLPLLEKAFQRGNKPVRLLGIGVKLKASEDQVVDGSQLQFSLEETRP